jgi:hypothetical protein
MHALVGFTRTSLLVGLVWAAWHYPINIAVSQYGASFAVVGLLMAFLLWRQRHGFQAESARSDAGAT